MIEQRLNYAQLSSSTYKALVSALMTLDNSSLDKSLIELIFMRVSQLNGCAYCLNMHGKALRDSGVNQSKIDMLAGWQVSGEYSDTERAALAWAESVTQIATTGAPDNAFDLLKKYFSDTEISDLTFAISIMNAFNRLAVSLRQ
ncbi:carboxymuconolactone decarboxylase family protein [Yersinia nurmii]|uniref:4-carboxymuconolactone decarboxylase n=1 Tax=Yersinia nurmii TaxID=685706 RepID=A0AAW7KAK5_9GAMM|nr:carboxymuconolactone decarboxylase family protein [Yersinia nurmii]MDN0089180.1 carboxymuconolactone decarboxylase family protein [Yersinia nurmii]CNF20783.1 4-carboxymuconolactone decarboxylase [Yersinia nurmii]